MPGVLPGNEVIFGGGEGSRTAGEMIHCPVDEVLRMLDPAADLERLAAPLDFFQDIPHEVSAAQPGGEQYSPIIVISARSEDSDKIGALDAGADDYLTKPFSVDELLARLRVTQRRLAIMNAESTSSEFVNGSLRIDYAAGCAYLNGEEMHLTPMEYKLLCLLAQNVGKVLTHTFITQKLWGSAWESNVASLRVFMATLRKKLESAPDSPQFIQTHVGVGYRMMKL